mmetsp:Transcript_11877/g.27043  ORF Transcript_11877/g.27043 Transcript_11877/m.27043 type:complete len:116 (-) Transcript_11877:44-391(-)
MGNDKIVEHRSGDNILSPVSLILKLLAKWKHLGLLGYAVEWLLEYTHVNHRFGKWLGRLVPIKPPRVGLIAVSMIIIGHIAEHLRHDEEHHHHEHRIAQLEANITADKKKVLHQH